MCSSRRSLEDDHSLQVCHPVHHISLSRTWQYEAKPETLIINQMKISQFFYVYNQTTRVVEVSHNCCLEKKSKRQHEHFSWYATIIVRHCFCLLITKHTYAKKIVRGIRRVVQNLLICHLLSCTIQINVTKKGHAVQANLTRGAHPSSV